MTLWAVVEIIAISKREGVWIKGEVPSWSTEVITLMITALLVSVVVAIHPWLSGVAVW